MSESLLNLSAKAGLTGLAQLVADMRAAVPGIEPLLVGAMARDLLLHHAHDVPVQRATEDVDLAFAVADWEAFLSIRAALIGSTFFQPQANILHTLRHRSLTPIDLIPFGGLQRADGMIAWPPSGDVVMSVVGFREAQASVIQVLLPEAQRIATVALPMFAVLKVLTWTERRTASPRKDATDIMLVMQNYLDAGNSQRLYSVAAHLVARDDFDYEIAAAWLLGHDAAGLLRAHSAEPAAVIERLHLILAAEADPDGPLRLVGESGHPTPDHARRMIAAFLNGLTGNDYP